MTEIKNSTSARSTSVKNKRNPSDEIEEGDRHTVHSDSYLEEDDEYERDHAKYREMIATTATGGSQPSQKRKRVLSAKARAAIEQEDSSEESLEPLPKKKPGARAKKASAASPPLKQDPGIRPEDAHPASLVRLKSPLHMRPPTTPPPKLRRKYDSYSDAVSGRSLSASEDDTISSRDGDVPDSVTATVGDSTGDDTGSLVDFIDDRDEEDLSVDSVDSLEEPKVRKSRSSKKRGVARGKSNVTQAKRSRMTKGAPHPVSEEDAIVISDSEGEGGSARARRNRENPVDTSKVKAPISAKRNDVEAQPVVTKGSSSRRRQPTQDRIEGRSRERRDKKAPRAANEKELTADHRPSRKSRSGVAASSSTAHGRDSDRRGASQESPQVSDASIDWPPTPEIPLAHHSKKAPRASLKEKKMMEDKTREALSPGQDILLADSYIGMEPLKHVELVPLFGSQDPPEEEALKLSDLLRLYESTPAAAYLPDRLTNLLLFQQKGVLINPARANLNKVTTSNYGTSTYFIVPPSVVKPRNGSLPFYACFLATGVCAYSYLYRPAEKNLGSRSIVDHRLGIYPIEFEYQRGLTYMANAAKKQALRYSFTSGILAFTSKTEGSSDSSNANFGASPKKSAFHRERAVPASQLSASNPVLEHMRTSRFPAALSYSDNVPIFDARGSNFLTGPFDLSTLHALPLITTDIEESSVVTVGYTSNVYVSATGSLAGVEVLSMNIQFVVVHAGAPP